MKRRYRISAVLLLLFGGTIAVFAVVVAHDSPCEPSVAPAAAADAMQAIVRRC